MVKQLLFLTVVSLLAFAVLVNGQDILWQDNFDDDDPIAWNDVGWFYYHESDGLIGSVVEQREGQLYMEQGSYAVIGAVIAGTNGVPYLEVDENGDETAAVKEMLARNDFSDPNQELTFQVNFATITGSWFIMATRMIQDDDKIDSDPTESPGYLLFISPLLGQVGLANNPAVQYIMLNAENYVWMTEMKAFQFEIGVNYWVKVYINQADFKAKIWEGGVDDEPEAWLIEAIDPAPRVEGKYTYFGLLNPDPNGKDVMKLDNITMRSVGGTAVEKPQVSEVPAEYILPQNFPNPFNPSTTIDYSLAKAGHVDLTVYNATGQKIATLVDDRQSSGHYSITWNGRDDRGAEMTSGVYFCRMVAGGATKSIKMILMK